MLALAAGLFYFFSAYRRVPQIPLKILSRDLDPETIRCLDKTPLPDDPIFGTFRFENRGSYADYFYRAVISSVDKTEIDGCKFIKLDLATEYFLAPFTLYLPERLPSPGTVKTTLPAQLSAYENRKVDFMVRYLLDKNDQSGKTLKGVLGWQLIIIWTSPPFQ